MVRERCILTTSAYIGHELTVHEQNESRNDTHIHVTKHDVKISIDGNLLDPVKWNSWMLRIISFSTTNVTIARDGFFFFIRHAILDFGERR